MSKGLHDETLELLEKSRGILIAEHPMTLRQLFYRLVSCGALVNDGKLYKKMSEIMKRGRTDKKLSRIMAERHSEECDPYIDPSWIVDRSKPEIVPNMFRDFNHFFECVINGYRLNYWEDQPYHVEVWTEKDSLTGSIENIIKKFGVTLRVCRGYGSTTRKLEAASLFDSVDKPIKVFYIGDFDPSGVDIERDLRVKIKLYQRTLNSFEITRLAINKEDITEFNLPPLQAKKSDTRAEDFKAKHGDEVVEADALPPSELRRRIEDAIYEVIDIDKWERKFLIEKAETESFVKFMKQYPTFKVG